MALTDDDVRRRLEDLLVDLGRDSSPESIDQLLQSLSETNDPDLIRGVVDGSRSISADWLPDEETGVIDRLGDIGISLHRGALAAVEAPLGIADIVSGGMASKAADWAGVPDLREADRILGEHYGNAQKRANRAVAKAEGLGGVAKAALENPSVIAHTVLESLPLMLGGGALGRLAMGAKSASAGAVGEGLMSAGLAARESGEDGLTLPEAGLAALVGGATSAIGRVGAGIAGAADVDTMAARGIQRGAVGSAAGVARGAVTEAGEEVAQSIAEEGGANIAAGRPLGEGMAHATVLGGLSGGAMGLGAGMLQYGSRRPEVLPPEEQLALPPAPNLLGAAPTLDVPPFEPPPPGPPPGPIALPGETEPPPAEPEPPSPETEPPPAETSTDPDYQPAVTFGEPGTDYAEGASDPTVTYPVLVDGEKPESLDITYDPETQTYTVPDEAPGVFGASERQWNTLEDAKGAVRAAWNAKPGESAVQEPPPAAPPPPPDPTPEPPAAPLSSGTAPPLVEPAGRPAAEPAPAKTASLHRPPRPAGLPKTILRASATPSATATSTESGGR